MLSPLILLVVMILIDLAAWRWGADSRHGINDPEWERRRNWIGFH
ncbi:hypothetical protein [Ktedonosporobacter rubrisoli]|nr:hypothetical protein [Ktedonosporobacter rubrisoli]